MKLIPNWFVTSKTIKKFFNALYANQNIFCFNEDSGNVEFSCNEVGIINIDLKNINLDNNFDEDDPDNLLISHFWLGILNFKNAKHVKKS